MNGHAHTTLRKTFVGRRKWIRSVYTVAYIFIHDRVWVTPSNKLRRNSLKQLDNSPDRRSEIERVLPHIQVGGNMSLPSGVGVPEWHQAASVAVQTS